jgi:FixJ family two-component response regulator
LGVHADAGALFLVILERSAPRPSLMGDDTAVVFVVDDDTGVRDAIRSLLASIGLEVQTFESASEFLGSKRPEMPACLVLDVRLPDLSGLDLQRELVQSRASIPIVFITGHGDIPMSVQAMKGGAVEFLTKPFRDQQLLDAVQQAIARDRAERKQRAEVAEVRRLYESLTPREREVLARVVAGRLNKQIAFELGMAEITVKVHRAQVMQKMRVDSLAALVQLAERLRPLIAPTQPPDVGS